jgi:hypothetical protein
VRGGDRAVAHVVEETGARRAVDRRAVDAQPHLGATFVAAFGDGDGGAEADALAAPGSGVDRLDEVAEEVAARLDGTRVDARGALAREDPFLRRSDLVAGVEQRLRRDPAGELARRVERLHVAVAELGRSRVRVDLRGGGCAERGDEDQQPAERHRGRSCTP